MLVRTCPDGLLTSPRDLDLPVAAAQPLRRRRVGRVAEVRRPAAAARRVGPAAAVVAAAAAPTWYGLPIEFGGHALKRAASILPARSTTHDSSIEKPG